jgi:hypothetical protein
MLKAHGVWYTAVTQPCIHRVGLETLGAAEMSVSLQVIARYDFAKS